MHSSASTAGGGGQSSASSCRISGLFEMARDVNDENDSPLGSQTTDAMRSDVSRVTLGVEHDDPITPEQAPGHTTR
jgi:hypothetical protein